MQQQETTEMSQIQTAPSPAIIDVPLNNLPVNGQVYQNGLINGVSGNGFYYPPEKVSHLERAKSCTVATELTWKDVSYNVTVGKGKKKSQKTILTECDGKVVSGQTIALMGGSGAGKTSLLNVLAGRVGDGQVGGSVLINGDKRERRTWKKMVGYVEQEDLLFTNLTVRETLQYSAQLRLPDAKYSKEEKLKRVEQVMVDFGIDHIADSRVGVSGNGISGGEKKRLAIAQELITEPKILFLDEPTSGLDSSVAFNIVESLKQLAVKQDRIVLMAIHQPRETIMDLFDKVILMSRGRMVWFGSTKDAIDHFAKLGYPIPPNTNPGDFFIDLISVDNRDEKAMAESTERYNVLVQAWENMRSSQDYEPSGLVPCEDEYLHNHNLPYWKEVAILTTRDYKNVYRDPRTLLANFGQTAVILIVMGLLYFGLAPSDVQGRSGLLFFIAINLTFSNMFAVLQTFALQRQIIKRERSAGTYHVSAAFCARALAQIPLTLATTLFLTVPIYWLAGLNPGVVNFFRYVLIVCLQALTAMSLGMLIAAVSPTPDIAQALGPLFAVIFILFGGNFASVSAIPPVVRWLQWVSIIRYSYSAMMINEFSGVNLCSPGPSCPFPTGDDVLNFYSLGYPPLWLDCVALAIFIVGFLFLAMIGLRVTTKPKFTLV